MVSSELVVLLIVCVSTGSTQGEFKQPSLVYARFVLFIIESCQDETDRTCSYDNGFDTNTTQCVSIILNCDNTCTAVINTITRDCQFMITGANVSHDCCLCYTSDTSIHDGPLIWQCTTITPLLTSCEQAT